VTATDTLPRPDVQPRMTPQNISSKVPATFSLDSYSEGGENRVNLPYSKPGTIFRGPYVPDPISMPMPSDLMALTSAMLSGSADVVACASASHLAQGNHRLRRGTPAASSRRSGTISSACAIL